MVVAALTELAVLCDFAVSGLIAWPRKAKCGRAAVVENGDWWGARASSRSNACAHAATCCKCFERVPCVCGATTRGGPSADASLRGLIVLDGRLAEDGLLCLQERRRCLPGAPVPLANAYDGRWQQRKRDGFDKRGDRHPQRCIVGG